MNLDQLQQIVSIIGALLVFVGSIWGLAWFLSNKFSKLYDKIDSVKDTILAKLEYHERHDDSRFQAIGNDLLTIKVRNAAKDNKLVAIPDV